MAGWSEFWSSRSTPQQGKAARGLLRRYVERMTGLSRAQVTRLIARYTATGRVVATVYRRRRFPERYTRADIELLATVDEAHETLSGPATRRILQREFDLYGKPEYARLATISVAHLYNLRHRQRYRERLLNYTKTRPTTVQIGERRKPQPNGQPGFLRLDTVHQGDQPGSGAKGIYHINAVDEVTQWEVVGAVERISEAYLEPVLQTMLRQFPFRILGFHSDNGSEFINKTVARLLEKLRVEQTKKPTSEERRQRPGGDQKRMDHPQTYRLRISGPDTGRSHRSLLSRVPESIPELPSPLRSGRCRNRPERTQASPLQTLSNSAGDPVVIGQTRTVPARWTEPQSTPARRRCDQRYGRGATHAKSKNQALRFPATNRVESPTRAEEGGQRK